MQTTLPRVFAAGEAVHLCDGERGNIKLTTPDDLTIAAALLEAEAEALQAAADSGAGSPDTPDFPTPSDPSGNPDRSGNPGGPVTPCEQP